MLQKLKQHPTVQSIRSRYDQMPQRDQRALKLLALALALALVYLLVWRPVAEFREDARGEMASAEDLLGWIQGQESIARNISTMEPSEDGADNLRDGSLLRTVTESAENSGLSLQRFEPSGDDAMRIWVDDVPFTDLAQWLAHLQSEYGIGVDQVVVDRTDEPGLVDARITLEI